MAGLKKRSAKCSKLLTESLYGDSVFYLSLIKTHIYSVIILKIIIKEENNMELQIIKTEGYVKGETCKQEPVFTNDNDTLIKCTPNGQKTIIIPRV